MFLPLATPAQIREKYEEAHRSSDSTGIKSLDYFFKKKTDHYQNLING